MLNHGRTWMRVTRWGVLASLGPKAVPFVSKAIPLWPHVAPYHSYEVAYLVRILIYPLSPHLAIFSHFLMIGLLILLYHDMGVRLQKGVLVAQLS